MNKIYKSIWNEQTGTYVAVSENTKAKGKRSSSALLASAILAAVVGAAQAQTVEELDGRLTIAEGSITQLKTDLGAANTNIGNLQSGLSTAQGNITGLQSGLSTAQGNITGLQSGLSAAEGNITNLQSGLSAAEGNITNLQSGLSTAQGNITGLQSGLSAAQGNIDALQTDYDAFVIATNANFDGLTQKLTDLGVSDTIQGIKYFRVQSTLPDAEATGLESIAIGQNAKALANNSMTIGQNAKALANNSMTIGQNAQVLATGQNGIAIGQDSKVAAADAFAAGVGAEVTTEGKGAIAFGQGALAGGGAPGAGGEGAVAIGRNSIASGTSSVALGDGAKAQDSNATALGANALAGAGNTIAIGNSKAVSDGAIAAGNGAYAGSPNGIALGTGAGVGTTGNTAEDRVSHIAIGNNAGRDVSGNQTIAIGDGAGSDINGYWNVAVGAHAGTGVIGNSNISIGGLANKGAGTIEHAIAIGEETNAETDAVSIGYKAKSLDTGVALGSYADAGAGAVALGRGSSAEGASVALGIGSAARSSDAVGSGYLTGRDFTDGTVVSVGDSNPTTGAPTTRRIVNVEDGAQEHDAVNVRQLKAAEDKVSNLVGVNFDSDTGAYGKIVLIDSVSGETVEFNSVVDALSALNTGGYVAAGPDVVKFNADGQINNLTAGTLDTDAVNVKQMEEAIAEKGVKYFSVNSSEPLNRGNTAATGVDAIAIGPDSHTKGHSSIAAGHLSRGVGAESVAIGYKVEAHGNNSTVVGNSSEAYHDGGVAIGEDAESHGLNSIAMGTGARSHPKDLGVAPNNTIVIGTSAEATAHNGIAIGEDAEATEARAIAQGFHAHSSADDAIAFGSNADADGVSSQAFGTGAHATGTNAQASGTGATASGYNSIATGTGATSYGTDGVAMGTGAVAGFDDPYNQDPDRNKSGIAIGNKALADEEHALALGVDANARAKSSTAIGDGAEATAAAENGLAIGKEATVSAKDATAIGTGAEAEALNALAMGTGAEATAKAIDGVAIGTGARVDGESALAFGYGAQATAEGTLALGSGADAEALNATAMGVGANAQKDNSMALGTGAIAYHEGSVALGSGSVTGTDDVIPTTDATVDGVKYDFAGAKDGVVSTVSVGAPGEERTISNVAAGRLTEDSTDAINGSQLHATNRAVTALGNNLDTFGHSVAGALGGDSTYDPATHTVDTKLNVNGKTYGNVNDAIQYAAKGWDLSGSAKDTVNIGPEGKVDFQGDNNISVAQTGVEDAGVIAIKLAKDVDLGADGSLQTGATVVDNDGVSIGDVDGLNPSTIVEAGNIVVGRSDTNITINAETGDITGLTNTEWDPAGTYEDGRAATEEQLKLVSDVAENANQGWNVTTNADAGTSQNVAPGATVDFNNTDGNIVISQTGTNLVFNLNDTLSIGGKDGKDGSIGVKGADGKDGISINPDAIVFHGIDGVDGKDGSMTMITGEPGVDGKDGITRIQYTEDGRDYEVATLDDGLNFKGDGAEIISLNLNEQLNLTGGAAKADLTDRGNIGVVEDGSGGLSIQLAKDIDLGEEGSLTTGDTVVDTDGLRITGASDNDPSTKVEAGRIELFANPTGAPANTIVIDAMTGDITGLSNINLDSPDFATAGRAATEEQLKAFGGELTAAGLNFVGNNATQKVHKDLGETLSIVGGLADTENASNANIRVDAVLIGFDDDSNPIYDGLDIKLATKLTDLEDIQVGKDGKDGVDGTIGVNGKDGSSVVLNGKDGSIGLTGPRGEDGAPGASTNISVKDGTPGVDGKDGETTTRIVYTDPELGEVEVATLNDGLSFVGDDGEVVYRKLNETLGLVGGADTDNLSEKNIGVVQKDDGSLSIQLSNDLVGLNSVQVGGDEGPVLGGDGTGALVLNPEGDAAQISNVASGLGDKSLGDLTDDSPELTNAANIGDLQSVSGDLVNKGLNFAGNTGDDIHKDLGETLRIVGGLADDADASDANIRVDSVDGALNIKLATSLTDLENIQVGKDGKDGVDGTIGVNGKDGASVVLNGKDGSIGLTGPRGEDGAPGASTNISVKDGTPGVDGKDGETTTRIVYTDEKGDPQEVANLNDGLKFVGDDGNTVTRKLNQTLGLTGGVTEPTDLTGEGNIGVVQKDDGALSIQLAKDIDLNEDGSLTVGDTTVNDKGLVVHDVTANPTATTTVEAGKIELFANPTGGPANTIAIDAYTGTITGLTNKTIDYPEFANGSGRAATEEQLSIVNETANKGWNVTTNEADVSENVAPGGSVDFDNTDDNIVIAQDKTNLTFDLAKDLTGLNSATFTNGTNTTVINHSGLSITDGPSVTVTGIDAGSQKITNVAKGDINADSTDAINGSQLWTLSDSIANIFGENVAFDPKTGGLTMNNPYEINGEKFHSVYDAIEKLAKGWDINVESGASGESGGEGSAPGAGTGTGGPTSILPGDQLTLVAGDNIIIEQQPKEDKNVNIEISVNPNLVVDSVTAGQTVMDDSGVKVGDNVHLRDTGLTIIGGPTGDLAFTADKVDVGGNKIENVANGIIADGSKDAINGGQIKDISQSVADAFGGGSTVNSDGTVSAPTYTVGNQNKVVNNVGDALDILNQGWTLSAEGNDTQVQAGDKVSLVNHDKNIVITHAADSGTVAFNLSDNIQVGETITIGGDKNNQTVINQGGITTNTVTATSVTTNNFNAGGGTMIVNEGSVAIAENTHINMGGNRITNVAPGVDGTDAVNMNQLGTVANSLSRDIRRVDREARAGTASAAAMANLPQAYLPGKSMFAVAAAGHRGESGYAAGLSTVSDNGKWVIKGSVAGNSRGDVTYGAGVGYQW